MLVSLVYFMKNPNVILFYDGKVLSLSWIHNLTIIRSHNSLRFSNKLFFIGVQKYAPEIFYHAGKVLTSDVIQTCLIEYNDSIRIYVIERPNILAAYFITTEKKKLSQRN